MKIYHLLMLQFILGLFGCSKKPTYTITSRDVGPFTIETISQTGKAYNINYGMVNETTISYGVKIKGESVTISNQLETNTGVPGIWRVFILKDALNPSLILGSQSLYLVTLENDKPIVKPLFEQGSDFASIQWLDSEAGQPGLYREIYSSDEADAEIELSGGRYMAITHAVVFDIKTTQLYPFNINHDLVDGYYVDQRSAVAFSPDSAQVVYVGSKQDEKDYMFYHHALISYDFKAGTMYAVPFDRDSLYVKDVSKIASEWINDYFEWKQQDSGSMRLQLKTLDKKPYRKGIIFFERNQGYKYILDPVSVPMLTHLAIFIKSELQIADDSLQHIDEEFNNRFIMAYQGKTITVLYGEYGTDLVVTYEGNGLTTAENKILITSLAKGFNALLHQGKYQEDWQPIVRDIE